MNTQQYVKVHQGKGFIAALDQSGGSTPKALRLYGVAESSYSTDQEMFDQVHAMRERIIMSCAFTGERILGAILFEDTLQRTVGDMPTSEYLWEKKNIVPFLKVDKGLLDRQNGVQLMKAIPELGALLEKAVSNKVFGTKMRSVILEADTRGIDAVVEQQFSFAQEIQAAGLVPILEPETDIASPDRQSSEEILLKEIRRRLASLPEKDKVMFKFSIPVMDNLYKDLMADPHVVRIVALSGGFSREEANEKLMRNHGLIASFSRALTEGLTFQQSDDEFDAALKESVDSIYTASVA